MRHARKATLGRAALLSALVASGAACSVPLRAQTCTTQSKLTAEQRSEIGAAAYGLATAVQAGDTQKIRSATIPQYAGEFDRTGYLVRTTSERLAGDALAVTQVYLLDATARQSGATTDAEFACPLSGTVSETDFSIAGLPPGQYAFVTVEARGPRPWLLAFLLQHEGRGWQMAGFYPHERTAAGHDGLWYWTAARTDAKTNKPWLAWLRYGEADQLLRPANFVTSGNLDKLRSEQRGAAPGAVSNGISDASPMMLGTPGKAQYRVTGLTSQASEDGHQLNLVMHIQVAPEANADVATERNLAAAGALLAAHPELRQGFDNIWVIADAGAGSPFVVERPMGSVSAPR